MTTTKSRLSENLVYQLEKTGGMEPLRVKLQATSERGETGLGDYLRDHSFEGAPVGDCSEHSLGEKFPKRIYAIGKEIKQYPDVELTVED